MGSVRAFKPQEAKYDYEWIWLPVTEDLRDLRLTMFPEEDDVSVDEPELDDEIVEPDLDRSITFRMDYDLFDKIQCFSATMGLATSELIRRLLAHQVEQFGPFQKIGKKSG